MWMDRRHSYECKLIFVNEINFRGLETCTYIEGLVGFEKAMKSRMFHSKYLTDPAVKDRGEVLYIK